MIIETIGAIPYRCKHCESMYLWTPSIEKGTCGLRSKKPECEKQNCLYYEPNRDDAQCPFCSDKYEQERISLFRYKIARALRRKRAKWMT